MKHENKNTLTISPWMKHEKRKKHAYGRGMEEIFVMEIVVCD